MRFLYPLLLLFVFALTGCFQSNNDSSIQPGGIPMPVGFQGLPVSGTLSVKVYMDEETSPIYTDGNLAVDATEISINFSAPAGPHTFRLIFEFINDGGNSWVLAHWTSAPVTVIDGGTLALDVDVYIYEDLDEDGVSNADELSTGTDPGNPDDFPFAVTATAGAGGSISPASRFVIPGATTTFAVTPNTGYSIDDVTGCSGTLDGSTYTTGQITEACTVSATFSLNNYTVSATAAANGSIDPASQQVSHGSTTTITVTPNTGYSATVGGTCGGTLVGATYTTNAITAPCTVTATFTLNQHTVSTNAGVGGFLNPTSRTVNHGATATFTVFLAQGFNFDDVNVTGCDGTLVGNVYTTGPITEDCTVTAIFSLNQYAVSTDVVGEGGSIDPGSRIVEHGATTTFTVTPDTGYSIGSVLGCNGTLVGNTYTTGAITGPCRVDATFTLNSYVVSATAGPNGDIVPASQQVNHGSTTTFTVTPDTGYSVTMGGTCPAGNLSDATYTTGVITADCTVTATFTLNQYTVTATGGPNGSISPPSQVVDHGATTTFTVTPSTGYSATMGGTCGGTLVGATYTTNAITADCTVSATFSLNSYTVTSSGGGAGGTITPASQSVDHGATTTFTVTPTTGYSVSIGSTCAAGNLSGTTYTTGVITANCSVTATFTLNSYTVTSSGGGVGGTITPASQSVNHGATTTFTVTPTTGYGVTMGGTCAAGNLSGTTYTTGVITANCTVTATFTLNQYPVTATAGPNGAIAPASRTVNHGATTTFTVTPDTGYSASVGGTCGGNLSGATYTTNAITQACTVTATFGQIQHTVTATAGANGNVSPPSQQVNQGAQATITVTPNTGYSASVGGTCGGNLVGTNYITDAITAPCTVTATFTLNQYSVTATAGPNGAIAPASRTVNHGATTTFTVTPDTGYSASVGGTCGGNLAGTTYTTNAITQACTVTATFTLNQYSVTATAGPNGAIAPASRTVNHGATTTFTVTPDTGYSASVGGTCGGNLAGTTYTTNAITQACTVTATFTLNQYSVTATAGPNGAIAPASRTVNHGATTTFTVTPDTGYSASVGGTCGGNLAGTTYTTNAVTAPCTVTATFTLNSYTVTSSGGGVGGTITPASQSVDHGATTTFTVTPTTGYSVTMGGTCAAGNLSGTTYTTGVITANCTVTATFTLNSYTVTSSGGGVGGTITPASQSVDHGATTTFTVTPTTGYSVTMGGTCAAGNLSGTTYTTGVITANCSVTATFTLNSYTVTASAGPNGAIAPASRTVNHGATTTFTVTPDSGYSASVGGTCGGNLSGATYTTNAITQACTVTATFTLNQYSVTATAGANGAIDPASRTVNHGATTTFTVTPDSGYSASVGGTCGGNLSGATYTTNAITQACTVTATFTLNQYSVTATAGANGNIAPPSRTVNHGATTTFNVNPDNGYIAIMDGTCGGNLAGTTYTTNAITANCTVSATFDLEPLGEGDSLLQELSSFAPVYFADNFNGGVGNWTVVNDVPSPASSWNVVNGALRQETRVESVNSFDGSYHKGAYAYYTAGSSLTDYRFSVDARALATSEANDIGIMFRFQDNNNYYRLSMNARYGFTRLEKKVGGVFTPLAVNARGYIPGELIRFIVEVNGSRIQVWANDEPMFAANDASLGSGTVALYTQDQSSFDNVVIDAPTAAPLVTLAAPPSYTVVTTATLASSAVATQVPAGGRVEFLLNGTRSVVDATAPYSATFDLVSAGDHTVVAIVRDAANVELARDTNIKVGAQGENIISLGDSITNGSGDRYSADNRAQSGRVIAVQGYQANLTDLLDASLQRPTIVYNAGIGGDRSANTLSRISSIQARHPGSNQALVLLGTNDALSGTVPSGSGCSGAACNGTFKGNMQSLINTLNAGGKTVNVARIPPVFGASSTATPYANPLAATPNVRIQGYNAVINNELNAHSPGPDLFSWFLSDGENRFSLFADPLHPNSLGHVVIAHLWHNALNPGAAVALPFILGNLGRSTIAPYLKQNLLEVGNAYYVDRSYTLTAIPPSLNGGVWLMTANNDTGNTAANYVSFEVDRPVTVYIAYDAGATSRPNWMSTYTDTGQSLGTNDPVSPSLRLYRRDYSAGTITLGGNQAAGAIGADSHYVAIVVAD